MVSLILPFMLIMLLGTNYAFSYQLCSKLCRHNWESPTEQASSRGVLEGGGGGGTTGLLNKGGGATCRLPALVTKQQAVEFPQVQTI